MTPRKYSAKVARLRAIFSVQKGNAKYRNIEWELSFEQWWEIWKQSGKFHLRGRKRGCYVMARYGDAGPYKVDNVRICLHGDNNSEAWTEGPRLEARLAKMRTAQLGRKRGPQSSEWRAKISRANKGRKRSEATREKLRQARYAYLAREKS